MFTKSRTKMISALAITAALLPTIGAAWGGYANVEIVELTMYQAPAAPGGVIKVSSVSPNLEGCSPTNGDYVWIDTSQPEGKALYATALAAQLAGRRVDIGVHGCAQGYPRVYAIIVRS